MLTGQWLLGKTLDGFLPLGPYLVTADEVGDPDRLGIRAWLNGELRQDSSTRDMVFSVQEIVSYVSRYVTLDPGDIILTGTPEGVIFGDDPAVWLKAGDEVRVLVENTRERLFTLVHGDYSPKNVLIHNDKLILLDHEVIHFGDPAFDLGFGMTHLLSKAHHLPRMRSAFAQAALDFWTQYRSTLGEPPFAASLETYAVRHALGCLLARVAGRSPLEYRLGEEIVIAHGTGEVSLLDHGDKPFTVAGVLAKTGTPVDRSVYVSLEGIEVPHWAKVRRDLFVLSHACRTP